MTHNKVSADWQFGPYGLFNLHLIERTMLYAQSLTYNWSKLYSTIEVKDINLQRHSYIVLKVLFLRVTGRSSLIARGILKLRSRIGLLGSRALLLMIITLTLSVKRGTTNTTLVIPFGVLWVVIWRRLDHLSN